MDHQFPLCEHWDFREKDGFWSESLLYLLQVIELHGYLSEEEVDVGTPFHDTDKIRLYIVREREREKKWEREEGESIWERCVERMGSMK